MGSRLTWWRGRRLAVAGAAVVVAAAGGIAVVVSGGDGTGAREAEPNSDAAESCDDPQVHRPAGDGYLEVVREHMGANVVLPGSDGETVFATGPRYNEPLQHFTTAAYDPAEGTELWAQTYVGPGGRDSSRALVVSPDGGSVFATGASDDPEGEASAYVTVGYDAADGTERWVARYQGPAADDEPVAVTVSPDGSRVFVTGTSATVAYDAVDGAELWVARHGGPDDGLVARDIAVAPDGETVFVTGAATQDAGEGVVSEFVTVAHDAVDGSERWVARHSSSDSSSWAQALVVDAAQVYVTGSSAGVDGVPAFATVAYDAADGAERWVARYEGPEGGGLHEPRTITPGPVGSGQRLGCVLVTGQTEAAVGGGGFGAFVEVTVAYDAADGAELWVARNDEIADAPGG